jgi:hypothetical protein
LRLMTLLFLQCSLLPEPFASWICGMILDIIQIDSKFLIGERKPQIVHVQPSFRVDMPECLCCQCVRHSLTRRYGMNGSMNLFFKAVANHWFFAGRICRAC